MATQTSADQDRANADAQVWANVYNNTLQELAETLREEVPGTPAAAAARLAVLRKAKLGLKAGEVRTLEVGTATVSVYAVDGGATYVKVARLGEELNAFSGSHRDERAALSSFYAAVTLILK